MLIHLDPDSMHNTHTHIHTIKICRYFEKFQNITITELVARAIVYAHEVLVKYTGIVESPEQIGTIKKNILHYSDRHTDIVYKRKTCIRYETKNYNSR